MNLYIFSKKYEARRNFSYMKSNSFFRLSLNFHIETISRPGIKKDSMMNTITTLPQKIYSKLYCDPGNNLKTPGSGSCTLGSQAFKNFAFKTKFRGLQTSMLDNIKLNLDVIKTEIIMSYMGKDFNQNHGVDTLETTEDCYNMQVQGIFLSMVFG